jgi:hypothetical protein
MKVGLLDHEKGTMSRYRIAYSGENRYDYLECGDTLELLDTEGKWVAYHIGCTPKGYRYLIVAKTNKRLRHIITGIPARKNTLLNH